MQMILVIIPLFMAYCECHYSGGTSGGYSGGSSGGGYGSVSSFGGSVGTSGGSNYGSSGGSQSQFGSTGPVQAAIETHRTVEIRPVNIPSEPVQPQVIEVPSEDLPVTVHFKSQSSRVFVQQTHIPGVPGETEHTSSEDEPHRVVHEVVKPVIQEVREIIQPYRRLVQQIQPVIEQTHTIISKGEPRGQQQQLTAGVGSGQVSGGSVGTGGAGYSAFGGASYGGGSSSYSSRSGSLMPPTASAKDRTVAIEGTGSSNTRIKYMDSSSMGSDSMIKTYKSGVASRARAA